jgi:hypothetical protein
MDADPKIERHARTNAFMAAMASAAGLEDAAQDYLDRMMRAWALLERRDSEVVFDGGGESGCW